MFINCKELEIADIGQITSMKKYQTFYGCNKLKTLILRNNAQVLSLSHGNVFDGSSLDTDGTGGTVYVPRALIESYQTATNWSTLYAAGTCTFLPLEDYTVDGTTTGELDWDKINGGVSV